MYRILSILVFIFLFQFSVYSQQFIFTNYSINEGLSQSVVNCIYQDSKGFIWIGTQNGLNRFDGENFRVYNYNPADTNTISNNWIYAITEDHDGNLWVGTKDGLNKYLTKQDKFQRIKYQTDFKFDLTQYIYDVECLFNGKIVINTPPIISIYNPENQSFSHFKNEFKYDGSVKDICLPVVEDVQGNIWIGCTEGIAKFSQQNEVFKYFPFVNKKGFQIENIQITAFHIDENGILWVGTSEGLFNFNDQSNNFEPSGFYLDSKWQFPFENSSVTTIVEDKNGNLILGVENNGLYAITQKGSEATVINYNTENSGIVYNIIQSLLIDRSENLWIGTLSGMSKTDLKRKKFKLYRNSNLPNSINLQGNVIASLFKDDGFLWVGNWGQGLNKVSIETNQVEHFSTRHSTNYKISNDFVHVIFKDEDGRIWLGTRDGIMIYIKSENRFISWVNYFNNPTLPSFDGQRIYMIIMDKSSNYWIGTQNGLYKINLKKSTVEVFRKEHYNEKYRLSANLIYCLLEDSDGLIWIATVSGLDVYNPATKQIKHFNKKENGLSDDLIISLCEDSGGKIWVGTGTYLNIYDKEDSTFTWLTEEQGLPNNHIYEIIKDIDDNMWVATGKGLCKYNKDQNRFHTFTLEDGLQSLEFNLRAACVCNDGEILVGGMNGFNAFYPDSISINPYIPNLVFTSFYKTKGTQKEHINLEESNEVSLKYNESSFTIEFAALEYTNPQKNSYMYQMEGVSDDWVDIGSRKFVPFSGLPSGDYIFKVKGSNNDGIWNNSAISINISVLPPWWRSVYAYLAYVFIIVMSVVTYIKMRERKLIYDKKILEKKILERTIQINNQNKLITAKNLELKELVGTKDKLFSIIGHDLGNQFNIIVGFLEVLVSDFKKLDAGKIEHHLINISNTSKYAYNLLENLLTWARMQTNLIEFNPEIFIVNEKISESIKLFEGASVKKNIEMNIVYEEELSVYADVNMFLTIFRNLVGNAIKFTQEDGKVTITIKRKTDFCEITVKDNGVGISDTEISKIFRIDSKHKTLGTKGEKGTGLGLILCKEFVEKQNGQIWVESELGSGSTFGFTLPLKSN